MSNQKKTAMENIFHHIAIATQNGATPWETPDLIALLQNIVEILNSDVGYEEYHNTDENTLYTWFTPIGKIAVNLLEVYFGMDRRPVAHSSTSARLVRVFANELLANADVTGYTLWPRDMEKNLSLVALCCKIRTI